MPTKTTTDVGATSQPKRSEIPAVSWVVSRWLWAATLVLFGFVVLLVGLVGALLYGDPFVHTLVLTVTVPDAALLAFLTARGLAFVLTQRRRDYEVATGELQVTDDTSPGAAATVASFSLIGVVAAGLSFPILYSTHGHFALLAVAITVLTVPLSYLLLTYQLGELARADRYRRGYRVAPAVWHYLWTLPLVVLAWSLLTGHQLPLSVPALPSHLPSVATGAHLLGPWDLGYVAVCAPTATVFAYSIRRLLERYGRAVLP